MADITEEELLAKGKLVSGRPIAGPTAEESAAPAALTDEEILATGREVKPAGLKPPPPGGTAPTRSVGSELLRQLGLTARYALEGSGNALDIGAQPIASLLNMATGSNTFRGANSLLSEFSDIVGLPRPQGSLEKIIGAGTTQGFSAMTGAGGANLLSNLASSPTTAGVLRSMATQPGVQTAASTLGGAAGQSATEVGFNPYAAAGVNILATGFGNLAGQRVGNAVSKVFTPEGQRAMALNEAAKKEGVKLSAGDLGNRTAATVENFLQDVPFSGRDAFMQQQAQQTKTMLERFRDALPKGEPGKDMVDAIRAAYNTKRNTAKTLYDAVDTELAKVPGSNQVALPNFNTQATKFLKEFPKYLESPDVPESVKSVLRQAAGNQAVTAPYQTVRDLRTMIGNEIKAAQRAGKPISGELSQLYKNLARDVDTWSTNLANPASPYANPSAAAAFGQADNFFKANVVPFKADPKVRKIVSSTTTQDELDIAADGLMGSLFKAGNANKADYALKLTGKPGEKIAQTELVQRGLTPGLDPNLKAGVSPMRFVNSLDVNDPMVASVLNRNGPFADQVRTLADIAQATRRSVTAFEVPRTGVQNKALATVLALANPVTMIPAAAGLAGAQATQKALRSDPVKSLLFAQGADPYSQLLPILNAFNNNPK